MKNIAIVAHKYLPQPDDDLVDYLNKKGGCGVFHIKHSFPDASDRRTSYSLYSKGSNIKEKTSADYKFLPEVLVYIKELFFMIKWIVFSKTRWDLYIGMDGLCAFFGLLLKKLGVCEKVVYWSIDFVPFNRFRSGWKNFFYRKINSFACRNVDEVWDLSPRMAEGRKKYLGVRKSDYKIYKIVPYGVWTKRIKKVPYSRCQKNTLVFMGHLMKKQGVDLVIKKIPEIVKKIPDFKFKIIGDGGHKKELVRLVKQLKMEKHCRFLGRLESAKMEREIAKSAVAIAPYAKTKDSYTYYADPGKVKTYLACGVPVLLTDIPWNAKEIEKEKCGLIIEGNGCNLIESLLFLMKSKTNEGFRKNATRYSGQFDYQAIFSELEL